MKKLIIGYILGILSCIAVVVIAESINSSEVLYDNSNSLTSHDNVQDVLDDVYNIIDHNSLGFSLLAHNPTGLSTSLVAGLYRYQGIQDANNNVDNYICFGTTNKSTCTGNTDKYMYRIIGINPSGQMKVIKKDALDTTYQWNSSNGAYWAQSDLYAGLNGNYFLTNTTYVPDSSWSNRIANVDWLYGEVSNGNVSALEIYNIETNLNYSVNAKIGLMYLHDYYYGLEGGNNCTSSGAYRTCKNSWIHLTKNDTSAPYNYEWIILRRNSYEAWCVNSGGDVGSLTMTYTHSVRPVFYLQASERIASGSGTLTDPYILS